MAKSGLTTKWIMWNLNKIVGAVRRSWDSVLLHPSLRAHITRKETMNKSEAAAIADAYIAKMQKESQIDIEINHNITEEHPIGYVFFYNSKEFWKTREFSVSLAGNGPLLVLRSSGELVVLPSYQSVEKSILSMAQSTQLQG